MANSPEVPSSRSDPEHQHGSIARPQRSDADNNFVYIWFHCKPGLFNQILSRAEPSVKVQIFGLASGKHCAGMTTPHQRVLTLQACPYGRSRLEPTSRRGCGSPPSASRPFAVDLAQRAPLSFFRLALAIR